MAELSVEGRLKIAEEIFADLRVHHFDCIAYCGNILVIGSKLNWHAIKMGDGLDPKNSIAYAQSPIDCVALARQKLAQEAAEAELPECAKKWRAGLKNVIATLECIHDIESTRPVSAAALQFARQALES